MHAPADTRYNVYVCVCVCEYVFYIYLNACAPVYPLCIHIYIYIYILHRCVGVLMSRSCLHAVHFVVFFFAVFIGKSAEVPVR